MKKTEAIKWMTDYIMRELSEERMISIELKKNMLITPFPNYVTAPFGTRELLRAFDTAMNKAIDCFHEQGKKVYDMKMCSPDDITIMFFTNGKKVEQDFKEVKKMIGIPSNLTFMSGTPDIKLD